MFGCAYIVSSVESENMCKSLTLSISDRKYKDKDISYLKMIR